MKGRRVAVLVVILLLAWALSGCWSRLETNELAVVIGYGVDWHGGEYEVTASILDPRALGAPAQATGAPNRPAHLLVIGTGPSPGAAFADVDDLSSRRVLWGSSNIMVIGESLAEHGIDPLLSAITHDPAFRPTVLVLIAHGDARGIFEVDKSGLETSIGRQLHLMVLNQERAQSNAWAPHVFDIVRWEAEEQRGFLVPGVRGIEPKLPEGQAYTINDSAAFRNGHMIGWMPRPDVRQVIWSDGSFIHGRFSVDCPDEPGKHGVVFLTAGKRQVRPIIRGNRIAAIHVALQGRGLVAQGCPGITVDAMAAAASARIASLTTEAVRWAQEHDLDVFGFGETVYRQFPPIWLRGGYHNGWPKTFPGIPVKVSVRVQIPQPGMTG